jgi:DNA-directed RNA polymerase III subunit RPC8
MIMRPFVGEVLVGRIRSCTEEGVCVSLHFFDDVFIPARCLQASSRFNTEERLWVWHYDGNDLFMDLDEPIRFRVLGDAFAEIAPARKETAMLKANKIAAGSPPGEIDAVAAAELPAPVAPYKIIGTIAESGLGLLSWWKQE